MSNYGLFEVKIVNRFTRVVTMAVSQTIHVYDVTNGAVLADIASDANGHIAAGTLPVAVGTQIRFSFWRADGECGKLEVTTY
jgi:hypothetical protein